MYESVSMENSQCDFKNLPLPSEFRGEHAICGMGFPGEIMSLWPAGEPRSPLNPLSPPLAPQVHVKVSVPKGIKFVGHPGKHHLTRKKCVPPGEATPTSIVFSVTELGPANITGHYLLPQTETFSLDLSKRQCSLFI